VCAAGVSAGGCVAGYGPGRGRCYLGVDVLARSRMTLINTTEQSEEAITSHTAGAISA
jgi:hypothetical protein